MRKIGIDKKGDAVMVTAVLLLSIALSFGSNLLINYGETMGKEDEVLHLTNVEDSLMKVRNSMFTQIRSRDQYTTIINQVTLGTLGNPFIGQARSSGKLEMDSGPSEFHLEVLIDDGGVEETVNSVSGAITYYCNNYYFHDRGYRLEGGGLFLQEIGEVTVNTLPMIDITKTMTDWNLEITTFGLAGGDFTISGIEGIPLSQSMLSYQDYQIDVQAGQEVVIRINSISEIAWAEGFRSLMILNELVEGSDYSITEPADWNSEHDHLDFRLSTLDLFDLQIGEMEVEIL